MILLWHGKEKEERMRGLLDWDGYPIKIPTPPPPFFLSLWSTMISTMIRVEKRKRKFAGEFTKQEWVKEHVPKRFTWLHITWRSFFKWGFLGGQTSFTSSSDNSYAWKFRSLHLTGKWSHLGNTNLGNKQEAMMSLILCSLKSSHPSVFPSLGVFPWETVKLIQPTLSWTLG